VKTGENGGEWAINPIDRGTGRAEGKRGRGMKNRVFTPVDNERGM
jgi:hypothetical protein